MENKINLAEILKNCPKGMELDCTLFDDVVFEEVDFSFFKHPVIIRRTDTNTTIHLTKYGQYVDDKGYKCVIFPNGKTTWEGFIPPYKFKDGDIVATSKGGYIFMLKKIISRGERVCYGTCYFGVGQITKFIITEDNWCFSRLATEQEKQTLFDVIKANGYKWNKKTKTLEKLITPKFKIGDRIKEKNPKIAAVLITDITDDYYIAETKYGVKVTISMDRQHIFELVPNKFDINTLVPFDKVLVRHDIDNKWNASLFSFIDKDFNSYCYKFVTIAGKSYPMMIPYEGNKHLLGTTNDCEEYYKTWEERA